MERFAPSCPYEPPSPEEYDPGIGLIGCGGITDTHLTAYRDAGYEVVAFCDVDGERARAQRDEHYPEADAYTDADAVYARDDVAVVDIATPPAPRVELIEDAIRSGKHVLSQKPFVLDLDVGERLVDLVDDHGVRLAVNQNGRWAPHWSYARAAVEDGLLGDLTDIHLAAHWDHDWIAGTHYDDLDHAILYDFAIHYVDFLVSIVPDRDPASVYAVEGRTPTQDARAPLLAEVVASYDGLQASLVFGGNARHGPCDRTYLGGTDATLVARGADNTDQTVHIHRDGDTASPALDGSWFPDGFRGTMGELLSAVESDREPLNGARENLRSLELCFAAVAAAADGEPKTPGEVRSYPGPGA
jgi:predicted dehydrogenase